MGWQRRDRPPPSELSRLALVGSLPAVTFDLMPAGSETYGALPRAAYIESGRYRILPLLIMRRIYPTNEREARDVGVQFRVARDGSSGSWWEYVPTDGSGAVDVAV